MLTAQQEAFVQGVVSGLSQRKAYIQAYPAAEKYKPETVDSKASALMAADKVRERYETLIEQSAKGARLSRQRMLERLENLADVSDKVIKETYEEAGTINYNASTSLISATKELLQYAQDDVEDKPAFIADFALLLAPSFLDAHRLIERETTCDIWAAGGRGSTKSSWASLEIIKHIERNPEQHGLVMMRYKVQLRNSAYAQVVWAIHALGLEEDYDMPESTLCIKKKSTGQKIFFCGCDNPNKVKGVKPQFGYIGAVWIEETDMFRGMAEIRKVLQSATRGGASALRMFTFNPPRSKACWINAEVQRLQSEGAPVFASTYLDVSPEWLGEQFINDAEELKRTNEQAYNHEYLGIPVGLGGEVFDRAEFRSITDEEIASFDNMRCGQDFGWWPDPWAFTISEWHSATRTIYTWYEDGGNKLPPNVQAERIKAALTWSDDGQTETYHEARVMSDDARNDLIAAQKDAGVKARPSEKGNMRESSYEFLQSCNWVIDPVRCPNLTREVQNLQYEQNSAGEFLNCIPDGNDHWIDATRYAFMREARSRKSYRGATVKAE